MCIPTVLCAFYKDISYLHYIPVALSDLLTSYTLHSFSIHMEYKIALFIFSVRLLLYFAWVD